MDLDDELSISLTGTRYVDPEIDFAMRKFALDRAVNMMTKQPLTFSPQDTVSVAQIYYQFLKGETK